MTTQRHKVLFPWQRGLQSRLTIISLLFALVPLAIVGALVFTQARTSLLDQEAASLKEIASITSTSVEQFFTTSLGDVKVLAHSAVLTGTNSTPEQKVDFLRSVQTSYGYYKAIYVTDSTGQVVASADQTGGDQSQVDWFQKSSQGEPFVTDMYFLNSVQDFVVTFSAPIVSAEGKFLGVIAAHVAGQRLFDLVATIHVGETGEMFIVNKDGRDVVDGDPVHLFKDLSSLVPIQSGLAGQTGTATGFDLTKGLPTLFSYVPIKGTQNWVAIGTLPLDEANAPINALAGRTGLVAGLAALFVTIIAFFVTRGIVQPVRKLAHAAATIGEGNWDVEVPAVQNADEIAQLAHAFGAMAKELKAIYASLEDRVRARTLELETVAEVSTAASTLLEVTPLLQSVSDLTKANFNLYHAHVYLLDETNQTLVLSAGAGEPGRIMREQRRSIAVSNERSLVARAARTRQGTIANDVTQAEDFLPNPLLPDTKSEMAVPMIVGERVIGVLDVQSELVNRFTESDVSVMTTLSAQVAVAVQNARAFGETEAARRQAVTIAQMNESMSKAQSSLDVLAPIFKFAPKENLTRASLMTVEVDANNQPVAVAVVAGFQADGSPLDLSVYPSTRLPFNQFRLLEIVVNHPNEPTVINNMSTDPRVDKPMLEWATQAKVQGVVIMPLSTGDAWHGMMVLSYAKPQNFAPQLSDILQQVMPTAASVMATRHAYAQETQARRETELRALELETVAEVSTATATILNVNELLKTVSDLTKANFNLYHAHVYLTDETGENLVLMAGAGLAGQIMKQEGRSIAVNNLGSLVARAARNRESTIANDVAQAPDFLPNPLLPDTKSEMAVPMIVGERVIGVLDVQSEQIHRFTETDARVMATLAAQIAVAVQNAQLYEQQLETTEQLRAVDRLKSEFLASMSHELRTPLNSIIGYSRMLLDSEEEEFSEDAQEDLSAIHSGGQHLLSLINDILDLAKIEADKMELDQESVKFENVAHEVSQMTSVLFKGKPLSLVLDIPANLPNLWADRVRLRQILNNLVSNAVKFTEQGEIRISAANATISNQLTISISDTGIGIPQEKLDLIFERFTQVDSSSARRAGGTGLGLTITKHLIEMHGGEIWAESVEGQGSKFSFTIPLVSEAVVNAN